jgi:polysaccharide pyruvyl transferase CsaB
LKKRNILIFGNYGGQNWGDEAILKGLLSNIDPVRFAVTVVTSNPTHTKNMHGVSSVSPPPFGIRSLFGGGIRKTIRALESADVVLFGGGGLFQDREKKAIRLWGWYHFFASIFAKKIIFVGNSVGPLNSKRSRKIARKAFEKTRFVSVRDSASKKILADIGISPERIIISTDAAFLIRKPPNPKYRKGSVLFIRGDGNITSDRLKKIFSVLPKPIRAVAMDQVDARFAQSLGVPVCNPDSLSDLEKIISHSKIILSSRLHGGILALRCETPFVLFSSAPKIKSFFGERGVGDCVFSERFQANRFFHRIRLLLKNSSSHRKKLQSIRLEEQRKSRDILPIFLQKNR